MFRKMWLCLEPFTMPVPKRAGQNKLGTNFGQDRASKVCFYGGLANE
jgi:hypothetical protein